MEDKERILDEIVTPINGTETKKQKKNFKNNGYKRKECKVIAYNNHANTLDINFDGYGIRIKNVKDFRGDITTVKYKGKIGKPNFECRL